VHILRLLDEIGAVDCEIYEQITSLTLTLTLKPNPNPIHNPKH